MNEYHYLAQDVDFPLRWGGSLEWYDSADTEAEITAGIQRIQGYGSPTWMMERDQVAQIEPNLNLGNDFKVVYSTRDGAVDPTATTRALVESSVANGAALLFQQRSKASKNIVTASPSIPTSTHSLPTSS